MYVKLHCVMNVQYIVQWTYSTLYKERTVQLFSDNEHTSHCAMYAQYYIVK